jgi:methyl-accepting chemotaxis protein
MDYIVTGSILFPIIAPLGVRILSRTNETRQWSANLGTTLGTLLTFGGICWSLKNFNEANISDSIPGLISGMKTSFYSSFAGLGTRLFINCWNKYSLKNINLDTRDLLMDLISEIETNTKNQTEHHEKLVDAIQTNSRQQFNLNTRLETFLEDFSKNSSKEIIEALQNVMESFNEKINDRLTDAIENLTVITNNVVEYQKLESVERKNTIQRLSEFNDLISNIKNDMEQMNQYSRESSKHWKDTLESSNVINQKSKELSDAFATLSSLSNDAKEASKNMSKFFSDWDREMNETTKQHIQTLAQHCHSIMNHMKNIIETKAA